MGSTRKVEVPEGLCIYLLVDEILKMENSGKSLLNMITNSFSPLCMFPSLMPSIEMQNLVFILDFYLKSRLTL